MPTNHVKNQLVRLERILNATTEGWWEWDIETDHMHHSPGWFAMLGIKQQDVTNMKFIKEMSFKNSHEMRAPVATMLGLVQLMKQELHSPGSVLEMINYLELTVQKMDEVIRDLTNTLNDRIKNG